MTTSVRENPGHILIAEDELAVRQLLFDQITEDLGYRVTLAANGREALDLFKSDPADVILADVRMPNLSGLELLREVKRINPRVPFLIMSGQGDVEDTITALRAGAQDFFQKPFKMSRLMASVERAFTQISALRLRRVARAYLVDEAQRFVIPNELEIVPHIIAEMTGSLENDPGMAVGELEAIRASLHEMILNAIEHGNLEINYDEKSVLMESPDGWRAEVLRRATSPEFHGRTVTIECENSPQSVMFRVTDQGNGFVHDDLPDPTQFTHVLHGRGILIARVHMDQVFYNEKGNQVTLIKQKNAGALAEA